MTSRRHLVTPVLVAAIATELLYCAGCNCDTDTPTADSDFSATTSVETGGTETGGAGLSPPECLGSIYVGRIDGDTCGNYAGEQGTWVGTSLGTEGILASFCEYRWKSVGQVPPDRPALPDPSRGVVNLTESCPRVSPQAAFLDSQVQAMMTSEFMANIGMPPMPMPPKLAPVAVRLIDTMPDGLYGGDAAPNSDHGLVLHELSLGILCPDGDCQASVHDHLGMPWVNEQEEDRVLGGHLGTLSDLALGLNEGVDAWDKEGVGSRQVFVLALGWEPVEEYGIAGLQDTSLLELLSDNETPADLQYVLASLARASCRGALIVAAAGNANIEPCVQSEPTGPGFLEALSAPTVVMCEALGFDHANTGVDDPHPLVLAATHITPDGGAPGNARVGAQAPLAAVGTAFGSAESSHAPLTGSSVAANVIALAAAWIWSYYPGLTPAQVGAILYESGAPLGKLADFPDPSAEARQISICAALKAACVMSGSACDALPDCSKPPGSDPAIDELLASKIGDSPVTATFGPNFPSSGPAPSACGGETTNWPQTELPALPPFPPPPWTFPMPGKLACPFCTGGIIPNGTGVKVGLEFLERVPFSGPILIELRTDTSTYRFAVPFDALVLPGSNVFQVITPPEVNLSEVTAINLGYVLEGVDGRKVYRSDPLLYFRSAASPQPCEGMMGACYDPMLDEAQKGVGACQAGTAMCIEDGWVCVGGGLPTPEDCSTPDIDEDCDGMNLPANCMCVDGESETCPFPPEIAWKAGNGICVETEHMCSDGQWDVCLLNLPEEQEDCSTPDIDENCDGVVECGEGVLRLVTGDLHTCSLTDDGGVRCWGVNSQGILGTGKGNVSEKLPPLATINLGPGRRAVDIRASVGHTCALLDTSDVMCWGEGLGGYLGYGNQNTVGLNNEPATAGIVDVGGKVMKLATGWSHTCALRVDGKVLCWGVGGNGRLGYGNTNSIGDDETPASAGTLPLPAGIEDIVAGGSHTCALFDTGGVKCWGAGASGQLGYGESKDLGDNETLAGLLDVPVGGKVVELTANLVHTCARLESGSIRCWGDNKGGRLGYDAMNPMIGDNETPASMPELGLGGPALQITAGQDFTCARLAGDIAKCWGMNNSGQLGQGHTSPIVSALDELPPINFGNGVAVLDIVAGWRHACVRTSGNAGKCWGAGGNYQLGNGLPDTIGDEPGEPATSLGIQFPW